MKNFKNFILGFMFLVCLVFPVSINAATIGEKIAGLYIAFFDRAADKSGLEYWEKRAADLGEQNALQVLAAGFAAHPKFTSLYAGMSNEDFVKSIYINVLGQAGDTEGIAYWKKLLDDGMSRPDMVADFVSIALDFDATDPQYASLSSQNSKHTHGKTLLDEAQQRKDQLANKVAVSLEFIKTFGDKTDLNPDTDASNPDSLDLDKTYRASINLLSNITYDNLTKDKAVHLLSLLATSSDAIDAINRLKVQYGSVLQDDTTIDMIKALLENLKQNNSSFGTITSPVTGRIWMDRNLGASEVCSSADDESCFGDYYQWGRYPDGHEKKTSKTTLKISSVLMPDNSDFVISSYDWTKTDISGVLRSNTYNVCPVGFRVPSISELLQENISNTKQAFETLKLPQSGKRDKYGKLKDKDTAGYLLSNTPVYANNYKALKYSQYSSLYTLTARTDGVAVRCIKVVEPIGWAIGEWSSCSGVCGTDYGVKTRTVVCKDAKGSVLSDSYCVEPKPAVTMQCTTQACKNENNLPPVAVDDGVYYDINITSTAKLSDISTAPTGGSSLKFYVKATQGEEISFDWLFRTDEVEVFWNDFAYVAIDDGPLELLSNVPSIGISGNTGIQTFTHTFNDNNYHTITFGISDWGDAAVNSYLEVSNINATVFGSDILGSVTNNNGTSTLITDGATVAQMEDFLSTDTMVSAPIDIAEGETTITGNVLNNDTDADTPHDMLTVLEVNETNIATTGNTTVQGEYGTLTIQSDGQFSYDLNNSNPTVNALDDGESIKEYFAYTISDHDMTDPKTDSANLVITINGVNDAPVAVINYEVNQNIVELDGSSSSDVDGDSFRYSWTIISKPNGSNATLSSIASVNPTFTADKYGDYNVTLVVNDGSVDSQLASVVISYLDTTPPVFDSPDSASVPENQTDAITLHATDETSVLYYISGGDYEDFLVNSSSGVVTFKTAPDYETKQTYTFTAIAIDEAGNQTSQNVTINVTNLPDLSGDILHNGVVYNIVTSPITGRTWLDRNLGADRVCASSSDTQCYGDYYQWGRNADGHEKSNSDVTNVQAQSIENAGNEFIAYPEFVNGVSVGDWLEEGVDDNGSLRNANWSKTDGTSVCPAGYRVPTIDELDAELADVNNSTDAFNNFLKLSANGIRRDTTGDLIYGYGNYWSDSQINNQAYCVTFRATDIFRQRNAYRHYGYAVRCIKEVEPPVAVLKTGQTTSYYSNDDGDLQRGITRSYTDNGDTITDNATKRIWQDNADTASVRKNWNDAKTYCEDLTLGGYSDWRLPSVDELVSIIDWGRSNPAINTNFSNISTSYSGDYYWTSTEDVGSPGRYWTVEFYSGKIHWDTSDYLLFIRCVRTNSSN